MKKVFVFLLTMFSLSSIYAQKILLGDMNGDDELTISDVTELVDALNGKAEKRYAYSAFDFIKENKLSGKFIINGIENNFVDGVCDPYNCHEYVDLGLSVKWATCNVGATSPEEYGDYFSWGETKPKDNYSWGTYSLCKGTSRTMTKYCLYSSFGTVDNLSILDSKDDAACMNWGGSWRMPSKKEQDELRKKCRWEKTKDYKGTGVPGFVVTSMVDGYTDKSIFIPSAGCYNDVGPVNIGSYGYYWSNQLYPNYSYGAYSVYLTTVSVDWDMDYRNYGMSVRAVCP